MLETEDNINAKGDDSCGLQRSPEGFRIRVTNTDVERAVIESKIVSFLVLD